MDTFPQMPPLWDINQFADADFLSLVQKQFPTDPSVFAFPSYPADAVNPQNVSSYSLPSLTPPSDDSSPSPSNSNQDNNKDDQEDSALKRKASDESLSDEPSSKTQHTDKDKKGAAGRRKSSGGTSKGKDETRLLKRKEQNRAAQRAFRERKEKHVKDLEDKVAELEAKNEQTQTDNENLRDLLSRLQSENVSLKKSSFTFSVPPTSATTASSSGSHNLFSSRASTSSVSSASSPINLPSPKHTNPLDWSSLTTFDPSALNLLDDVQQPTATSGAMHMDFGFGPNPGLASNSPFTTIASNPMFMSFASTFDSFPPPTEKSNGAPSPAPSATGSNSNSSFTNGATNGFGVDLNSLTPWPTSGASDPMFDELFSNYLASAGAGTLDFSSMLTGSPSASISPVTHHTTPSSLNVNGNSNTRSSPLTSLSSSPSVLNDPLWTMPRESSGSSSASKQHKGGDHSGCPSKDQLKDHIESEGLSVFAPSPAPAANVTKTVDGGMVNCAGSKFPKTAQSEQNVEVLTAWRTIRSDPNYKDADINELCAEFTSKAKCDGTKVVLEPNSVSQILEALTKKSQH